MALDVFDRTIYEMHYYVVTILSKAHDLVTLVVPYVCMLVVKHVS